VTWHAGLHANLVEVHTGTESVEIGTGPKPPGLIETKTGERKGNRGEWEPNIHPKLKPGHPGNQGATLRTRKKKGT